jgi:hypothetical protein
LEFRTVGTGDFVKRLISQCREYVFVEVGADFVESGGCETFFLFCLQPGISGSSKGSCLGRIDSSFRGSLLFKGIGTATHYFA